jgi:hypothetical protein
MTAEISHQPIQVMKVRRPRRTPLGEGGFRFLSKSIRKLTKRGRRMIYGSAITAAAMKRTMTA